MLLQDHFKAGASSTSNIFLASFPKSGTTWHRALIFATINRTLHDVASPHHPLLTTGPHDCFPYLQLDAYLYNNNMHEHRDHDHHSRSLMSHDDRDHDGDGSTNIATTTRLFATHKPYSLLPKSVTTNNIGGSKFVYICRNPKDVCISSWNFMNKLKSQVCTPLSLEEAFELFCQGFSDYGPFWDHVLGFWKASLEFPEKILFLKYEDLKKEPDVQVKRFAEFLGQPFSLEEESQGVVQQIIKLCGFENLSGLEERSSGDWKNFFTEDMAKRMDQITDDKLNGSVLTFYTDA
ncbi:hypothetical protein ACFX2I_038697 [Malus domestica]